MWLLGLLFKFLIQIKLHGSFNFWGGVNSYFIDPQPVKRERWQTTSIGFLLLCSSFFLAINLSNLVSHTSLFFYDCALKSGIFYNLVSMFYMYTSCICRSNFFAIHVCVFRINEYTTVLESLQNICTPE